MRIISKTKLVHMQTSSKMSAKCDKHTAKQWPRKGDIAVIVEGYDAQHIRTAEAMIVEQLASHGYRAIE